MGIKAEEGEETPFDLGARAPRRSKRAGNETFRQGSGALMGPSAPAVTVLYFSRSGGLGRHVEPRGRFCLCTFQGALSLEPVQVLEKAPACSWSRDCRTWGTVGGGADSPVRGVLVCPLGSEAPRLTLSGAPRQSG